MFFAYVISLLSPFLGSFVTLDVNVIDDLGAPIPDASVRIRTLRRLGINAGGCKWDFRRLEHTTDVVGHTRFLVYCVANDLYYSIDAPDHESFNGKVEYKATENNYFFTWFHEHSKTLTCVLKRKPIPEKIIVTPSHSIGIIRVKKGTLGFDLMKNDWVPPYGRGKIADFWIDYERKQRGDEDETSSRLYFKDHGAGFYVVKRELLDNPASCHVDPRADYRTEGRFFYSDFQPVRALVTNLALKGECLVMRTRVVHDRFGKMSSAHYSVIRGPFRVWCAMHMDGYMFNTRPNDTNLEFKGPIFQ